MKKVLFEKLNLVKNDMIKISDYIFDNPEIGLEEVKASKILTDYLEDHGFQIEKGIAGLDTAFRAAYENGTGGPSIGILVEYDALEGIGHACGHHMQGPIGLAVAVTLKEYFKEMPYKLVIYGTPAEETIGGKIAMVKNGYFQDIDIALMTHGGPNTTTDIKSLALCKTTVTFHGKSAHAAIKPEDGRSALDALLLTFNGIEFLREHIPDDVRIHYTVLDAGGPANVVPNIAIGNFYIRSYSNHTLETCKERFFKILQGASLMTETTYDITIDKEIGGKIPVLSLNDLIMKNAKELDAPAMSPPREKTGSTDFGSVMNIVPGTCLRIAFVPEGTSSHSAEYLSAGKSQEAHNAICKGSEVLVGAIYDIITDKQLLEKIKSEFKDKKNSNKY
ncbi:M20 family metallopeptidase [Fusobacterium sp. PH5-44]|uniref:M20 family metallopeptidase n=1 Tax=unclassified Fusobacterium TaxID=2648384 RepID=UPI003D219052